MIEIKKINVLSLAKIIALVWIFFGFILGIGVGLLSFVFGNIIGGTLLTLAPWPSAWLGIGGFILVPVILGLIGFITGLLTGWFYNLLSWWVGGIQIELDSDEND
ncbi:MAG: hypothetical protein N2662_02700 [Bacteroidales bacterium]|nr:hypothetical protein [Bacteroidales bacterium]